MKILCILFVCIAVLQIVLGLVLQKSIILFNYIGGWFCALAWCLNTLYIFTCWKKEH